MFANIHTTEPLGHYPHAILLVNAAGSMLIGGAEVPDNIFLRKINIVLPRGPTIASDAKAKRDWLQVPVSVTPDLKGTNEIALFFQC